MIEVQMNYYKGMGVENMSNFDAFNAGWEAFQKEEQRLKELKKKYRTFNPYDYVSTDPFRLFMQGVYYSNGYAEATDGRLAFRIKNLYNKEFDGKIIGKDGEEIKEQFPNLDKVIPYDKVLEKSTLSFDDFKSARTGTTAKAASKLCGLYVDMGEEFFSMSIIDRIVKFWSAYPNAILFKNTVRGKAWKLEDKDLDALLVFMPLNKYTKCNFKYDRETKLCLPREAA